MLWTLDVVERMADGKLQERSGSSSPWRRIRKLTSDERCCFEQAKHDGYVIVRRRTKDYALQNVWWRHCGALRLPHIRITPHRTPAEVEYDMLPTDGSDAGVDLKYYISGGCQIPEDLRKAFGDEWSASDARDGHHLPLVACARHTDHAAAISLCRLRRLKTSQACCWTKYDH